MIKQKKRTCKCCGEECYIFSHNLCYLCSTRENKKPIKTNKKLNKVSYSMKEKTEKYNLAKEKHFLENPICEFPECTSTEIECHHKKNRVGSNRYNFLMSVCRKHHLQIHQNPEESKKNGWLL